ncbi:MAG TPA: hypothetical protein VGO85_20635 [Caldimonas sp.]|nr:hypothetical protein [Caldimonas sp.]
MISNARLALSLAIALICTCAALAQPTPADPGAPPPPRVQVQGGVEYLNGGAGEEARAAIAAQAADFPLRIAFSTPGGAYIVADHVDVANASGKVLGLDNAGPLLAIKVPPGDYTLDVRIGGKSERRPIRVGREPVTLNWRLADDAKR